MPEYPGTVQSFRVRQGAQIARGTTIDEYLSAEQNILLYEKWNSKWPEPLMFSGGITAITCEMVMEVPFAEFKKVYGRSAAAIYEVAQRNATR